MQVRLSTDRASLALTISPDPDKVGLWRHRPWASTAGGPGESEDDRRSSTPSSTCCRRGACRPAPRRSRRAQGSPRPRCSATSTPSPSSSTRRWSATSSGRLRSSRCRGWAEGPLEARAHRLAAARVELYWAISPVARMARARAFNQPHVASARARRAQPPRRPGGPALRARAGAAEPHRTTGPSRCSSPRRPPSTPGTSTSTSGAALRRSVGRGRARCSSSALDLDLCRRSVRAR